MKKISVLLILLLCLGFELSSQQLPDFLRAESDLIENKSFKNCSHKHTLNVMQSDVDRRPYDVLRYDLYMDWTGPLSAELSEDSQGNPQIAGKDRIWTGLNKIKIRLDSADLEYVQFDGRYLYIDSVFIDGKKAPSYTQPNGSGYFIIELSESSNQGDTLDMDIHYSYINTFDFGFNVFPEGLYLGRLPAPYYDSVIVEERLAYTMSEPEEARGWMPCNDRPYDKALSSISIKVPEGFTAASNGLLDSVEETSGGNIFHWRHDYPISTYLMVANASKFTVWSDWYHRESNPNDSLEIVYYAWQQDYDNTAEDKSEYNPRYAFRNSVEQMELLSEAFGEYPFEKYGLVVVHPYSFGGMEHQTLTTVHRKWTRTDEQSGLVHELAHHWLGDLITCARWEDIWINEGGATWSEALYSYMLWGEGAYTDNMLWKRRYYMIRGGLTLPAIYGLPVSTIFGNYSVLVYQKASWIYHMLNTMLGREDYNKALHHLFDKYAYQSVTNVEFQSAFEDIIEDPPIPFDTFFNQWLMFAGHPVFEINSAVLKDYNNPGGFVVNVQLNQVQEAVQNVAEVFHVPVDIWFYKDSEIVYEHRVVNTERTQNFEIPIDFVPDSVHVDTTSILCEQISANMIVTAVRENSGSSDLRLYPNPVLAGQTAKMELFMSSGGKSEISVYDILGNKVKSVFSGNLEEGSFIFQIPTRGLSAGVYHVVIDSGTNRIIRKMSVN